MVGGGLAAKTALAAARSKTGRRLLVATLLVVVFLPLVVVAAPVGLATVAVVAAADALDPGDGGEGLPVCAGEQGCEVSGDAQEVARQIVALTEARQVQWLDRRFLSQVQAYAAGTPVAEECTLDVRVLQIIVLAVQQQGSAGVSSLNRRCTGQTPGAGTRSYHWKGKAVDFYSLGGRTATGADPGSRQLIETLGAIVPAGSAVGQSQCRAAAGVQVLLGNFATFADACNHLHIQVSLDGAPLRAPTSPAS